MIGYICGINFKVILMCGYVVVLIHVHHMPQCICGVGGQPVGVGCVLTL